MAMKQDGEKSFWTRKRCKEERKWSFIVKDKQFVFCSNKKTQATNTNSLRFYFVRLTGTLVRPTGIEPALREELDPKSSASANSATGAKKGGKPCFLRFAGAKLIIFRETKKYCNKKMRLTLHSLENYQATLQILCPLRYANHS